MQAKFIWFLCFSNPAFHLTLRSLTKKITLKFELKLPDLVCFLLKARHFKIFWWKIKIVVLSFPFFFSSREETVGNWPVPRNEHTFSFLVLFPERSLQQENVWRIQTACSRGCKRTLQVFFPEALPFLLMIWSLCISAVNIFSPAFDFL